MTESFVFISYAHADAVLVANTVKRLTQERISYWYDANLQGGDQWTAILEERIAACHALLVVVTDDALKSSWVGREVLTAVQQNKRIIPYSPQGVRMPILSIYQHVKSEDQLIEDLFRLAPRNITVTGDRTSAKVQIPFSHTDPFVNRTAEFSRLQSLIERSRTKRKSLIGITGTSGVGKTRFVAEYALRHHSDFQDGVVWIHSRPSLRQGLAEYGKTLLRASANDDRDGWFQAAWRDLLTREQCLLVIDDVPDFSTLHKPIENRVVENLPGQIVFTSLGRPVGAEHVLVEPLSERDAIQVLLYRRNESIDNASDAAVMPADAHKICELFGYLPLALRLAGAFLATWPDISLRQFLERLRRDGALATLDTEVPTLPPMLVPADHEPFVRALFQWQWEQVHDDFAILILKVCSQLRCRRRIPLARLAVLSEGTNSPTAGVPSRLDRALQQLLAANLLDPAGNGYVSISPLVAEWVTRQIDQGEIADLRARCLSQTLIAYDRFPTLEQHLATRGVDEVQGDLLEVCDWAEGAAEYARLDELYWVLARQSGNLRSAILNTNRQVISRQIGYEAGLLNLAGLSQASARSLQKFSPWSLELLWGTSAESHALVRTIYGNAALHTAWVSDLDDGLGLMSASSQGTLDFWNCRTGERLHQFTHEKDGLAVWTIGEKPSRAIGGYEDGSIAIYDLGDGKLDIEFPAHENEVTAVAVSLPSGRVVSASWEPELRMSSVRSGAFLGELIGHADLVNCLTAHPWQDEVASGGNDQQVIRWNLVTGEPLANLKGHRYPVMAAAYERGGKWLATGDASGVVMRWDCATSRGQVLCSFPSAVYHLHTVRSRNLLLAVTSDHTVHVIEPDSGESLGELHGHSDRILSLDSHSQLPFVVTSGVEQTARVWDLRRLEKSRQPTVNQPTGAILGACFDASGRRLYAADADGGVYVWDDLTSSAAVRLRRRSGSVTSLVCDARRAMIVAADDLGGLDAIESESERTLWTQTLGCGVNALTAVAKGDWLACGLVDGTLALLRLNDGGVEWRASLSKSAIIAMAHHVGSWNLACSFTDGSVMVVDLRRPQNPRWWHLGDVTRAIRFDRLGNMVLAGDDGCVRVCELASPGEFKSTTLLHYGAIESIAHDATGELWVTGGGDRRLVVWDRMTRKPFAELNVKNRVRSVEFSSTGNRIAVGDEAGMMALFELHELHGNSPER